MVFDWFNRRPEAAQPAQPAPSPEDTAASSLEEESVASAPSAASEGPQPNRWRRSLHLPRLSLFQIRSRLSPLVSHQPSPPTLTMTPWSGRARPVRVKAQKEQEQAQQESSAGGAGHHARSTTPPQSLSAEPRSPNRFPRSRFQTKSQR